MTVFFIVNLNFIIRNNFQCNINSVKQKFYKEDWKHEIYKKPKVRNYIQIKNE